MTRFHYKSLRNALFITPLLVVSWCLAANASTLNTRNFQIDVTVNCRKFFRGTCKDVDYVITDRRTGRVMNLKGITVHQNCASTKCPIIGYEFIENRWPDPGPLPPGIECAEAASTPYRYVLSTSGQLEIYREQELVFTEQGLWDY
jgi:hypothetical protein